MDKYMKRAEAFAWWAIGGLFFIAVGSLLAFIIRVLWFYILAPGPIR